MGAFVMISKLAQGIAYWAGLVGRPGLVGLALVAVAVALAASVVAPQQERIGQLEAEIEQIRRAPPQPVAEPVETQEVKVENFYRNLPQSATTPDWMQKIFDSAARNGVVLDQGEYVILANPNAKIEQYRLTFPVKGTYPQLRKFVAGSLESVPALALESATFKREKIADGAVEARIAFLLYLERGQ